MKLVKYLLGTVIVIMGLWVLGAQLLPRLLEPKFNYSYAPAPYPVSPQAQQLHDRLTVVDMHADSLLWNRDLLAESERGLVDVPRLIAGNVALQAFTLVTKTPKGQNEDHNTAETDRITLLTVLQAWPPRTWNSLSERALYQMEKLHEFTANSAGQLQLITNRAELDAYLASYEPTASKQVAGWLGLEGAHALEGDIANLQRFYDAGLRMLGIAHFFDNEVGGSAHGVAQYGLTEFGKEVVSKALALGMVIDVAHTSEASIRDIIQLADKPIMVSHAGVRGTCDNNRNLSDDMLRAIANTGAQHGGSVIGIGYWDIAICGQDIAAIVRAIDYTAKLIGVEHVGLGSDYDGSVATPMDTSGLALITEGLLAAGYSAADIEKIMGKNAIRVLRANLP